RGGPGAGGCSARGARAGGGGPLVGGVVAAFVAVAGELGRHNPLFAGLGELFEPLRMKGPVALSFGGVALHSGAIAAYRAAGLLGNEAAEEITTNATETPMAYTLEDFCADTHAILKAEQL